jgi:hypothetical protein
MWLVAAIAIAAIVVAFRRFASNERIAYAVSAGVIRRHGESVQTELPTLESSRP